MKSRGRSGLPAHQRGGIYVYRQWVERRGMLYWQEWCEVRLQFFDRSRSRCRARSFKKYGEQQAMRWARALLERWRAELKAAETIAVEPLTEAR